MRIGVDRGSDCKRPTTAPGDAEQPVNSEDRDEGRLTGAVPSWQIQTHVALRRHERRQMRGDACCLSWSSHDMFRRASDILTRRFGWRPGGLHPSSTDRPVVDVLVLRNGSLPIRTHSTSGLNVVQHYGVKYVPEAMLEHVSLAWSLLLFNGSHPISSNKAAILCLTCTGVGRASNAVVKASHLQAI